MAKADRNVRRLALGCVVLVLALGQPASSQVRLAWNLRQGDRFVQETTTVVKQVTRLGGQEIRQEDQLTTRSLFTVKERAADGSVQLEQKLEALTATAKDGSGAAAARLLRLMQGSVLTYTLTPEGRLARVEGYDELLRKVAGDDAAALKVAQTLVSRETLSSAVEEAFRFLPREPVRPGKSWERSLSASLGPIGSVSGRQVYTYEGPQELEGQMLHAIRLEVELSYEPPRADPGVLPLRVERGELRVRRGQGKLWFDEQAGRLVRSEMQLQIGGQLVLAAQGQQFVLELEREHQVQVRIRDASAEAP
jgi:hypothetical protein